MPVTQVSICNRALIRCGADTIQSINQDTRTAILCNALYTQMRDAVLRAHPWNFAIKRASITVDADTPAFEYDFQFVLPSDCLRVLFVTDASGVEIEDYTIESDDDGNDRVIRTSDESTEVFVKYIFRHTNEANWDSNFADAFAWKLATELSYPLTQSLALRDSSEKAYRLVLAEARSMDGSEGKPPLLIADLWTRVRR